MISPWNNLPDNCWDGDPFAPWNEIDDDTAAEWLKVNDPDECLLKMQDGTIDIDIFWLHENDYTIFDVCEAHDISMDRYIEEVKADDHEAYEELKKDIDWI